MRMAFLILLLSAGALLAQGSPPSTTFNGPYRGGNPPITGPAVSDSLDVLRGVDSLLVARIDSLRRADSLHAAAIDSLQEAADSVMAGVDSLRNGIDTVNSVVNTLRGASDSTAEKNAAQDDSLALLRTATSLNAAGIDSLQSGIDSVNTNVSGLQTDVTGLRDTTTANADSVAVFAPRIAALEADSLAAARAYTQGAISDSLDADTLRSVSLTIPGADSTAQGITVIKVAGETITFGQAVYIKSDGKAWLADADSILTMPSIGVSCTKGSVAANGNVRILRRGYIRCDAWNWTVGGQYPSSNVFVSGTAGALTHTAPSGAADQDQFVGIAETADVLWIEPSFMLIGR